MRISTGSATAAANEAGIYEFERIKMEKLRVAGNGRYFIKEDGTPFIWLADTAWTMPQRMKWDDVDYYMKKRKSQGFTVLQIVALDPEQDEQMRNPAGIPALKDGNLLNPEEGYFAYLDWILEKAADYGFYVLLLPAWGQLIVGENWMGQKFEKTVHEGNAFEYGKWIGNRYKEHPHILWCLGGDRQPIHKGVDYRDVWRRMAEGLAKGVTGADLKYNIPDARWQDMLMTYHACHEAETGECSTFSYWTQEEAWISFIMLQSGHGLLPKNYELVQKEYDRMAPMPVWDGEPAYEKMPTSWPVIKDFHRSWMVRKRAYWSLFAGAFGYTYGHCSVWCMISEKEKNKIATDSWFEALEAPGAYQVKILRDFLESRDLSGCVPDQSVLIKQRVEDEDVLDMHNQACRQAQGGFACIYFPSGGRENIDVSRLQAGDIQLWWFNPRDGKCYSQSGEIAQQPITIRPIGTAIDVAAPTEGPEQDWVLVIDSMAQNAAMPGMPGSYGDDLETVEAKKVFAW